MFMWEVGPGQWGVNIPRHGEKSAENWPVVRALISGNLAPRTRALIPINHSI